MTAIWERPRRAMRPKTLAGIVLTVLLMLGGAGLAVLAISLTSLAPALSLGN